MPPSTRRWVQRAEHMMAQTERRSPPEAEDDDTDSEIELALDRRARTHHLDPEDDLEGELIEIEGEEQLEEEEALVSPGGPQTPLPNLDPPPSYFREISTLASWTVSSSKPGCSIPQLRHPSTQLFWQSDGPQPHYLNIHFFKLVRIVGLRLFLDFEQDESYTPTRIMFLAGSGMNDLQEWGEMRLESPRGWVWADFSGVGDADSDSDFSDIENTNEDEHAAQHMLDDAPPATTEARPQDASSDSENNNPHHQRYLHAQQDDSMPLNPPQLTHQIFTPPTTTTDAHHLQTPPTFPAPTQSLTRPTPRLPFAALAPNTAAPRAPSRPRRPRMPVLRAHLVQIKILENHQNGKDTHLRGLQIFARNDDKESREPVRRVVAERGKKKMIASGKEVARRGARGKRSERRERLELGGFEDGIR